MKCKVNGFWNSSGTGTDDHGKSFSWNNYFFSVSYTDKKQEHMIGQKSKGIKVKAADLNVMLGLGLTQEGSLNFNAEQLESNYHVLGSTCFLDFDDDGNLIDFEILEEGRSSKQSSAPHAVS